MVYYLLSCELAVLRFHRVVFTVRFHRVVISPSDFTVADFAELRFRRLRFCRVAISPSDFTVWRFHHAAISPCGNFTERDFTMSRCHHAASVSSGSLYPTESRRNILYRLLPERCFFCRPRQREWTRGRICVPFIPVLTRIDTPQIVRNWPGAACAAAVKR